MAPTESRRSIGRRRTSSGDDELLIRANKNPNTRGLAALGLSADGLDGLASAVASGELKMLISFRADLVRAIGEEEFVRRFGALDYMMVLSTDANETCQMANQVWPIAAYPEIDGSFTNFQGRVQRIHAAFPPPGNAIAGVEAIARLGHALDGIDRPKTADSIFAAMASDGARVQRAQPRESRRARRRPRRELDSDLFPSFVFF